MSHYQELFDRTFGNHMTLTEKHHAFLERICHLKQYPPKDFLVEGGTVARYFYLVLEGVQALYLIDRKGEKVVLGFSYDGSFSGVYDSFVYRKNSDYFLEALTPSRLLAIGRSDYELLFQEFPEFNVWRIHFIESILFGRGQREVEMLTQTAKERYIAFTKRCPPPLLTIPQKYLASYLNMKAETYSRLRAQKFE